MTEQSRIEDLRRRIQLDPASIAFAAPAEEYRRAATEAVCDRLDARLIGAAVSDVHFKVRALESFLSALRKGR